MSLEELLRLKRAEQPPPEFWNGFETEFRQRQLASLLKKRPWWHGLAPVFSRRIYLPVGAGAVVALTVLTLRQYPVPAVNGIDGEPTHQMHLQATVERQSLSPAAVGNIELLPVTVMGEENLGADLPSSRAMVDAVVAAELPDGVSTMLPWGASRSADSPSARSIAANLARLQQSEPELLEAVLNNRLAASVPVQATEAPPLAVEMAAVTPGTARRSSRLLASYNDRHVVSGPSMSEKARERAARRLADLDLSDEVRRLDLKGNSLSLKL